MIAALAIMGLVLGAGIGWLLRGRGYLRDGDPRGTLPWWTAGLAGVALSLVFALLGWRDDDPLGLALGLSFAAGGLIGTWTDLDDRRLPDWLTWPLAVVLSLAVVIAGAATGEWGPSFRALLAGACVGGALFVLALVSSLGLGDVKLGISLGLLLGYRSWGAVGSGLVVGLLVGAVWAIVLLALGRPAKSHLPFGPSLVVGAVAVFALIPV